MTELVSLRRILKQDWSGDRNLFGILKALERTATAMNGAALLAEGKARQIRENLESIPLENLDLSYLKRDLDALEGEIRALRMYIGGVP